jgi:hypothetical protein
MKMAMHFLHETISFHITYFHHGSESRIGFLVSTVTEVLNRQVLGHNIS